MQLEARFSVSLTILVIQIVELRNGSWMVNLEWPCLLRRSYSQGMSLHMTIILRKHIRNTLFIWYLITLGHSQRKISRSVCVELPNVVDSLDRKTLAKTKFKALPQR